ncbi:MAG: glycine oxidase ThiO [Chloroflexi bacterium]|nr:glycine oxidase ThiO [Chloroflexota bacterium]
MADAISLTVNGSPRTLDSAATLPELLRTLGIDERLVAVAVNGEVIPKKQHGSVRLQDGDTVEIVRMVGGGAGVGRGSRTTKGRGSRVAGRGRGVEVVIAGGGIIGCAIACELSRRGVSCVVLDSRRLGMAATNAAAGILAPLAEFKRPGALVQLGLASMRRYPDWVARLREEAPDIDVEFARCGVLRVAFDDDELAQLRAGLGYGAELGVELIELDATLVRDVEPRLSPKAIGGVLAPEDGQVSNQMFTLALARAAEARGVRFVEQSPVVGFWTGDGRVTAVRTPTSEFACDRVVLAAGPWTRDLARKLRAHVPTFPVRGQMLALGGMVTPVRHVVWGPRGYLVPRANGLVFAGATVEQVGFRFRTTKAGLARVRRGAFELVPQLRHASEHFTWAGLRPGSPDGLPIMGPLPGWENVTVATGHFRNGILLAPVTGELIAESIVAGREPEALAPFRPARFNGG